MRKQQRLITPCPTLTEGGITVRIRTAAKKLFLTLFVVTVPSRPLIVGWGSNESTGHYVDLPHFVDV